MITAENDKIVQWFYAFSPATIKNVSKTIMSSIPSYLLLLTGHISQPYENEANNMSELTQMLY